MFTAELSEFTYIHTHIKSRTGFRPIENVWRGNRNMSMSLLLYDMYVVIYLRNLRQKRRRATQDRAT